MSFLGPRTTRRQRFRFTSLQKARRPLPTNLILSGNQGGGRVAITTQEIMSC
jgi:hypothetical protein